MCVCESALNRAASPHLPARSLPSTLALPTSRCNWLTGGGGGGTPPPPKKGPNKENPRGGFFFFLFCFLVVVYRVLSSSLFLPGSPWIHCVACGCN